MNLKRLQLSIIVLLGCPFLLKGQVQHELKLDVLNAVLNKNYILSYERIFAKKVGIEIAAGFDLLGNTLTDDNFIQYEFEERRFNPSLSGKYYLLLNKNSNGLFVGPYMRLDYLLHLEEGYYEKWEAIRNRPAPEWLKEEKGLNRIYYGLHAGFKWVIKSRIIVEPVVYLLIEKRINYDSPLVNELTPYLGEFHLKVGYRFPTQKSIK